MDLTSEAFQPSTTIPVKYTGEGEDVSPPLRWTGAPDGVRHFALVMDDPDAPRSEPWVHWLIYNIPGYAEGLAEGVDKAEAPSDPSGAAQGLNSWGTIGYGGPMPPPGHGTHHYHFKLYALDAEGDLPPGLSKNDLLERIDGHVLAETELVGVYERH
ncbi:MAG: YbhB/YbcL family Raf kinase inhibitor-like protein [Phycisphaerae bacterium]|nr:YbhB/YbcL family Raf kinase inhibitor-like protein [Phycisphaerae bacterium]